MAPMPLPLLAQPRYWLTVNQLHLTQRFIGRDGYPEWCASKDLEDCVRTMSVLRWIHSAKWRSTYVQKACSPRTSDFSRCDYHAAQMKHAVVYGSARTGDYLVVAIKKSQRVPLHGRHDCHLTTACTNETRRNKWVRSHGRLSPPLCETSTFHGHFLAVAWSWHKEFVSVMVFKEVYDCEILISEIESRSALYDCSLKE